MSIRSFLLIFILLVFKSEAKIVRYTFNISYFSGYPDGTQKTHILGINGQFPGPQLEAVEGDTLEISVINNIQDGQNTSIHWHGIHQKGSPFEDGASQITQCPLPAGGHSQTYQFKVDQPGTYWYHSHQHSQYTEGLYGTLIVHAKNEPYFYDDELTILLSDWYHSPAHEIDKWVMSNVPSKVPPIPDAGLMNGMGRYPCEFAERKGIQCDSRKQRRPVFNLEKYKTYRFRVINAASLASFNFSIDGHILKTIEVDGVDVKQSQPIYPDVACIAAGQRYSFLFQCGSGSTHESRYLIRAKMRTEFLLLGGENINKYPEALIGEVTGVINCYDGEDVLKTSERFTNNDNRAEFDYKKPVYLNEMELSPIDGSQSPDHVDQEFAVNINFVIGNDNVRRGSFNNSPFAVPKNKPLLMSVIEGETLPSSVFSLEVNYGNVVQLIINNNFKGNHPLHLHGHHFWVVGVGKWNDGNYADAARNLTLNGVKRDTVVVEERSWVVIRFVADNPGVWLFHCHMDWHNLAGMSLVFIEGRDVIRKDVGISKEASCVCNMHDNDTKPALSW